MDTTIRPETAIKVMDGLIPLLEEARDISAQWNGDEPGAQEERARICNDIFDAAEKIRQLIEELEEL